MTFRIHGFLNGERILNRHIAHLPRNGDTIRIDEDVYVKVTEVVWCLDEDDSGGARVNLRLEDLQS